VAEAIKGQLPCPARFQHLLTQRFTLAAAELSPAERVALLARSLQNTTQPLLNCFVYQQQSCAARRNANELMANLSKQTSPCEMSAESELCDQLIHAS